MTFSPISITPETNRDDIARPKFPFVGRILLYRSHHAVLFAHIGKRQPQAGKHLPRGLVEFSGVPHDVQVAHVVALPGVNRASMR